MWFPRNARPGPGAPRDCRRQGRRHRRPGHVGPAWRDGSSATWCSSASSRCRIACRARRPFRTPSSRTRSPARTSPSCSLAATRSKASCGRRSRCRGRPIRTYQQFTTERPTFATDDLLRRADRRRRDGAGDAARPAARLPRQPADLVCADPAARRLLRLDVPAPARRPRRRPAGRPAEARRSGNRARDVRRRGRHRRSGSRDQRGGGLPEGSGKVSPSRRARAQGRAAGRGAGNRQDAPCAGHGGRGQGPVLQRQRLRVHRDDRRRRRQPRPRAVRRGPQGRARHHLHRRDRHHRPGARRRRGRLAATTSASRR